MKATECKSFEFEFMKTKYLTTNEIQVLPPAPAQKNQNKTNERGKTAIVAFLNQLLVWKICGKITFDHMDCNMAHSYLNWFSSC